MVIAITGTPGSGKSTFASELSKALKDAKLIEINSIVKKGKHFSELDENGAMVVKPLELSKALNAEIEKHLKSESVIVVGHLVPELDITPDIVVVVKAKLKVLIERLEKRKYNKDKIRENIVSEAIDYCGTASSERWPNTLEINDDKQREEVINYILALSKGKKAEPPKTESRQRLDELLELVDDGNRYGF